MQNNICTNWQDVLDWIKDNKLCRYSFRADNPTDGGRSNRVIFAYCNDDSPEENLRLCEKRLACAAGTHLYGTGFRSAQANTGGICCDVQYMGAYQMPMQMQGAAGVGTINEEAITARIRKELTQEMKLQKLEDERKQFEAERKEFEAEKQGVVGTIIHAFAPYIGQLMGANSLANVAGAGRPVQAERIVPMDAEQPGNEQRDPDDLPDEQAQQAYELLKRFAKIEPQWLQLLESVVKMAESGNQMYNTAKSFLL